MLAFHLQPRGLTGGYVGVDVFFVISGFLITSHLLASPPRGLNDLVTFWSRRVARLLPAALLVLIVTLAGSRLVAPETQWRETADDVFAAGFYVVNWRFAEQAVDYLAADDLPSPVQHYWSLSVEEQFYAGWPVLILVLFALGGRVGRVGRGRLGNGVVLGGLVLTTLASLAWSMHFTAEDPARGYFVTPTRIWELGVGGILAGVLLVRGSPEPSAGSDGRAAVRRDVIAALGLAAIAWSAWSYSAETPFPGHHALVPVLGTAVVIAAAPRAALGRVLAVRPVQYVGDISYSVYLWHWPLIVLVPAATGHDLNAVEKLGVLVVTLALAAVTKHWVEDPFMRPRTRRPVALRFGAAATGMAVLAGLTVLQNVEVSDREADARRQLVAAASSRCFGAAALAKPSCAKGMGELTPEASAFAATDKSQAYPDVPDGQDCFSYLPDYPSVRCEFGPAGATTRIALVGNSHAGHWLPALQELADRRRWRITTFLSSQCALSPVNQEFATAAQSDACVEWVGRTTEDVATGRFAAVVLSNRLSVPVAGMGLPESLPLYERGYRTVLETWKRARLRVLVIRDTPTPGLADLNSVPDCLAGRAPEECSGPRPSWLPKDPAVTVVRAMKDRRIRTVDLTDRICGPRVCNPVVGGVVVYFDGSHLSATYARTLAPYLEPALRALLRL